MLFNYDKLLGVEGVGKTILLNVVNNNFLQTSHNFDVVIWVVISKQKYMINFFFFFNFYFGEILELREFFFLNKKDIIPMHTLRKILKKMRES